MDKHNNIQKRLYFRVCISDSVVVHIFDNRAQNGSNKAVNVTGYFPKYRCNCSVQSHICCSFPDVDLNKSSWRIW